MVVCILRCSLFAPYSCPFVSSHCFSLSLLLLIFACSFFPTDFTFFSSSCDLTWTLLPPPLVLRSLWRCFDPSPGQVSGTDGESEGEASRLCLQTALRGLPAEVNFVFPLIVKTQCTNFVPCQANKYALVGATSRRSVTQCVLIWPKSWKSTSNYVNLRRNAENDLAVYSSKWHVFRAPQSSLNVTFEIVKLSQWYKSFIFLSLMSTWDNSCICL